MTQFAFYDKKLQYSEIQLQKWIFHNKKLYIEFKELQLYKICDFYGQMSQLCNKRHHLTVKVVILENLQFYNKL